MSKKHLELGNAVHNLILENKDLVDIGNSIIKDLKKNDHITSDPMFLVQQKIIDWGIDSEYSDNYKWTDVNNEYMEAEGQMKKTLDKMEDDGAVPENWRKCYYRERWEYVQCFFTQEAADNFLKRQAHNMNEARVYVDSGYRNPQWKMLREFFKSLAIGEEIPF